MESFNAGALYDQYEREEKITTLEDGVHELEVISVGVKDNAIRPMYRVVGPPGNPQMGVRAMAGQMTMSDNAKGIFFQNLEGWGLGKEFFQSPAMTQVPDFKTWLQRVADALKGRRANVEIGHHEHNNQIYNDVLIGKISLTAVGGQPVVAAATLPAAQPAVPPATAPQPQPQVVQQVAPAAAPVAPTAPAPVAPAPAPQPVQAEVVAPVAPAPSTEAVQAAPQPEVPVSPPAPIPTEEPSF